MQAGQIEEVARYCETDVLNTYRVWLVYELFRGAITPNACLERGADPRIRREPESEQPAPVCGGRSREGW